MMASRKAVLDKNKQQLLDSVNLSNKIYNNEELSILLSEQADLIKQQGEQIAALTSNQNNMLNKTYPVGSIYISYSSTNPGSLFGGTWVAYATGRTLVGVDTSQTEFNSIGKVGGEKSHTLTSTEMPSHSHSVYAYFTGYAGWGGTVASGNYVLNYNSTVLKNMSMLEVSNTANASIGGTYSSGGSQAHNNLQPYITVYMWRRTA